MKTLTKAEIRQLQVAHNARHAAIGKVEAMLLDPMDDGYDKHDRITSVNASRFVEGYLSEALTTFAVGYKDNTNIEQTLEFFAPACDVPRRFTYRTFSNPEEWLSEIDDLRAIRGDFKTVEYTSGEAEGKTLNRGLRIVVDLDEVADKANWETKYTEKLLRRINRNALRRAFAALSAAAVNANKTWGNAAQPDADVRAALIAASNSSGIRPNRVGYGDTSADYRIASYETQNNAGSTAALNREPDRLAAYFGVDQVMVSRERYQSAAAAKSEIVSNKVLLFNALAGLDAEDASNIKRFTSPVEGGGKVRVFSRQISAKLYEIIVEHYEFLKITSTLGIRQLTVSQS